MLPKLIAALLLLTCCCVLTAQDTPSPQQLVPAIHQATDLSLLGPYVLTAELVATPRDKHGKPDEKKRQAGQLTVYRDHGRARFELRSGKQLETEVRIGSTRYVNPNQTALMALDLEDFDQSWDPESGTAAAAQAPFSWGDIVRKKIGDIDVVCFDRRARMQASVTFCADPANPSFLAEDTLISPRTSSMNMCAFQLG
jgi:hypothetical protein